MNNLDYNFKISIYRKPITKDCIIPFSSCHPTEHKLPGIRHFNNLIRTHSLQPTEKQPETT